MFAEKFQTRVDQLEPTKFSINFFCFEVTLNILCVIMNSTAFFVSFIEKKTFISFEGMKSLSIFIIYKNINARHL